jgi:hypothetical protein
MATKLTETVLTAAATGTVRTLNYEGTEAQFEAELAASYLPRDIKRTRKLIAVSFRD